MKLESMLLVVKDMEKAKQFYKEILGLHVTLDFGANVTLTGGLALQTEETWKEFIGQNAKFGGNDAEVYFEENDFDAFIERLDKHKEIEYVHPVKEHGWGQRVVRFYDLDHHIIEVGENMKVVCKRFIDTGMTEEEVAQRMDVPVKFVRACIK